MTTTLTRPSTTATSADAPPAPGYDTIRQAAAILGYDGAGLFEVAGPGAGSLLGQVTTRSVDFLLEGQSQQALVLDPQGLVVGDVVVHGLSTGFLLQVWPDQAAAVGAVLASAASGRSDVQVDGVSAAHAVLGVEGPASFTVVGHYVDFAISSLAYKSWARSTWQGHELMVSRTGVTGEFGYVLVAPAAARDALLDDLRAHGARDASRAAVDVCRMEMRFPNLEAEVPPEGATPFHLGLAWLVDFSGEFTGKASLLAAQDASELPVCWRGPVGSVTAPAAGTPVTVSDGVVGRVLHAVYSPSLDRCVGTALVDRTCAATGLAFTIDADEVETVSAPFLIATSFTTSMD
ncbi:glycine cleavage system aminomethyltransferase GcvT [Microlunatus lacustris]